ncbi:flagellar hook-associated protein FlgK [Rhodovibrio sodomensis]|uniref:Flagellar hook-associated protein 1 n=1 Tax=Rhodovibrio sodomensis TaxID=1088 RepID=A0ABS1DGG1_9PROT|nr:flagellar hook-associated protein FlgK [Rhodovibrio sodomensis]MBK1669567.1 flagellar hook-associated protein FlgK [Rhodovibrio sodomensis]
MLFTALNNAFSGLSAAQQSIDVVSRNVANASTPGYTRKTLPVDNAVLGGEGRGVWTDAVRRDVDQRMMQQLRTDLSASQQTGVVADYLGRVDEMFGRPQDENSIASQVTRFTEAFQELTTNPESASVREGVISAAGETARKLNDLSTQIQDMRAEAESGIAASVDKVNHALGQIAELNEDISQRQAQGRSTADLEDKRDQHLEAVAEEIDIRVIDGGEGRSLVFTPDGSSLVGRGGARPLNFDQRFEINANTEWSRDGTQRQVGTITLGQDGNAVDLIGSGSLTGGRMAGLVELRDELLPQAQRQLDELAHQMATRLSEHTVRADAPTTTSREIDIAGRIQSDGDQIEVTFTNGSVQNRFTFIASSEPGGPASNDLTARANDTVFTFQRGASDAATAANLAAQINAAVAGSATTAGSTLTVQDSGGSAIQAVDARFTLTDTQSGNPDRLGLPVFADMKAGQVDYTGSVDGQGQKQGFAARIALNADLIANPERLVLTTGTTATGDSARPLELTRRLAEAPTTFSPATGIGGSGRPQTTTLGGFAREIVSFQGNQAQSASSRAEDRAAVARAIEDRVANQNGVNIDEEMNRLMEMEKVYAANAKLMGLVDQMFDTLFAIKR